MTLIKKNKDNKGFWEYSIFQKKIIPNEEQTIKILLKPENSFDPKQIENYINPTITKEEIIVNKYTSGEKLSKAETIIYNKYIGDKENMIKADFAEIKNYGFNAKLKTKEGKIILMIKILENEIKKKKIDTIVNIYMRFKETNFKPSEEIIEQNKTVFTKMNEIISNIDLIEFQFTKIYSQMPPLNEKGFTKFDDWQINVIKNIDNKISTIVSAPTSAGKTVLAGYAVTKGRTLFVVPTDALAWQVASYLGNIINSDIPIITLTYQSIPKRDEFIPKLNSANAIVGTADCILDYLPLINCNFEWIVLDEIHMIGKNEGFAMESILKIFNDIPFLALSATIGNITEFSKWTKLIKNNNNIDTIVCNKRYFNLQKYFFDANKFNMINPLSMINYNEFENKSIINKSLDPTPLDTWSLISKIKEKNIKLGNLDPYTYFNKEERIELTKATKYFYDIIEFLSNNYLQYKNEIIEILNEYSNININIQNNNLLDVIKKLSDENKTPSIIFQQNTISCLKIVRKLSETIDMLEQQKYPKLYEERLAKIKQVKIITKKNDKIDKELTEKQEMKRMLENKMPTDENIINDEINAPHSDFIFNKEKISDIIIKEYYEKFKMYFPNMNGDYHFLIRLLWRGIGVYTIGLPDAYLRVVQMLATKKQLGIVFSDSSLVFGVSMPFRSVVIYHDENCIDNLDSMVYHQMAGRAGRRGLDKEGHIIFVGYSWLRIKELSISSIPNIKGIHKQIYTYNNANILCNNNFDYSKINKNTLTTQNNSNFIINNENNFATIWKDIINIEYNHNQLMWSLRYNNDCITVYYLLPYILKYFITANPINENDQVELAYFLSNFIDIKPCTNTKYNLSRYKINNKINYTEIKDLLISKNIKINNNIDACVWLSIKNNCLIDMNDDILRQELFNFSTKIKAIQHYCFHNNFVVVTKLLAKLLTRMWWIYHSSSPVIRLA